MDYGRYIDEKLDSVPPAGLDSEPYHAGLFPHQSDLVRWALRRGRCAIFARVEGK